MKLNIRNKLHPTSCNNQNKTKSLFLASANGSLFKKKGMWTHGIRSTSTCGLIDYVHIASWTFSRTQSHPLQLDSPGRFWNQAEAVSKQGWRSQATGLKEHQTLILIIKTNNRHSVPLEMTSMGCRGEVDGDWAHFDGFKTLVSIFYFDFYAFLV